MTRPPSIAFRTGLLGWTHTLARMAHRIELASSSTDAPLFLARAGDRVRWTPERAEAETFATRNAAWDRVVAERLADVVRVSP